jgi:DNA-binding XRE family transcriptional regulator
MSTITDPRQTLQGRLRAARIFASIEQADMAQQLGVARQTVSAWENGRTDMPATMLIRWSETTRISLDWIAWGTVRPEGFEPPAYCSVADDYAKWSMPCADGHHNGCRRSLCGCPCHDSQIDEVDVRDLVLAA